MLEKISSLSSAALVLGAAYMLLFASLGYAQSSQMGAGQMQMLEDMSPEQREQVLRSLADSAASGSTDDALEFPQVVQPMGTKIGEGDDEGELD